MCGFIGLLSTDKRYTKHFDEGLKATVERGNTQDAYKEAGAQYGYVRLPTDDTQNTKLQKIVNQDGSILLFNGLITNVGYLVHTYGLPPAASSSDQSCLKAGTDMYGVAFAESCRGMFAFAYITDEEVLLVRDTVGIKPLYYIHDRDAFAFASEIKALRPFNTSIYEVLPGQIIQYKRKTHAIRKRHYTYKSYRHYGVQNLEEALVEAAVLPTKRYLENTQNKRVALLLSGGLDSSVVAALHIQHMSTAHKQRLQAFCIGNPGSSDVLAATRLAHHLGLPLVRLGLPSTEIYLRDLPDIVYRVESPHARVVKVSLLYDTLAKYIRSQDIDVVVGGEGADELFFGYQRFIEGLTYEQVATLFGLFYRKVFYYTLLQRYERIFARRQIEGRVPYLDQEIIEFANRLEPELKIRFTDTGHISKLPLRNLAKQLGLPAYIYGRPKEKMTAGATGKENSTSPLGFLEQETVQQTGLPFQEATMKYYQSLFYTQSGEDILKLPPGFLTEEDVMMLAETYRRENNIVQCNEVVA